MNFKHSGATGDIIFSLPTIKAMGGGTLYIVPYDEQRANSVSWLIRRQPYISNVFVTKEPPADCIDLDKFRAHAGHHKNLVRAHLTAQGITDESWTGGWLTLDDLNGAPFSYSNYSIINRTTNYADPNCDWKKEVDYLLTFSSDVYFVGYQKEYDHFQFCFGTAAKFLECDFLFAAYLIKYANMFTGCYSAMSTIAMGLGINYRLEQAPGHTCSSLLMPRETIING
jgi:hypothetical protein